MAPALALALALGGCATAPSYGTASAMDKSYGAASPKNAMGPNSRWNATANAAGRGR